jgi:hypothetical protein
MSNRIKITITTPDGTVLDTFLACHWRTKTSADEDDADFENFGSPASESLLMHRIRRAAEVS